MSQEVGEVGRRAEVERLGPRVRDFGKLRPSDREEIIRRFQTGTPTLNEDAQARIRRVLGSLDTKGSGSLSGSHLKAPPKIQFDLGLTELQQPQGIQWVQQSLNQAIGAGLPVDGSLTPKTREAIRDFQRKNGLVPDGVVGPITERKLEELTHSVLPNPFAAGIGRKLSLRYGIFGAPDATDALGKHLVILDVKNRDGHVSVTVRTGVDYWFHQVGLPEYSQGATRDVSSAAELDSLIGDASTVVHRGDDLPEKWQEQLQDKSTYLRNTDRSPKKDLGEFIKAAQLLEHTAEPGKVRILSALPQARGKRELIQELDKMDLDTSEVEAWQQLQKELEGVQTLSGFTFELGTKQAFLRELREGNSDYIVLIAHFADERLYFPDGGTMTTTELAAVQRAEAPQRTVIFLSCGAGKVNAALQSPSEITLKGKMAVNVVAHREPISAGQIPAMMRDFLIERKTIKKVFTARGFQNITENIEVRPRAEEEIAYLFPAR